MLDSEQEAAVNAPFDRPLLIISCPGAGKTTTLIYRLNNLLNSESPPPESIILLTFSRRAASDLRRKLLQTISNKLKHPIVSTFHGFALNCIKSNISLMTSFGYATNLPLSLISIDQGFSIVLTALMKYDQERQQTTAHNSEIFKQSKDLDERARICLDKIAYQKAMGIFPFFSLQQDAEVLMDEYSAAGKMYQETLRQSNKVDFGDLIYLSTSILKSDSSETARIKYLLVDEFQDTSPQQFELIKSIVHCHSASLTVVGDDDQSIYSFQGACFENIYKFRDHFQNARTIILNVNYRSFPLIVKASSALIYPNNNRIPKNVICAQSKQDGSIEICAARNQQCEIKYICNYICNLKDIGESYDSIAVLSRTRRDLREFYAAFRLCGIPLSSSWCLSNGFNQPNSNFFSRKDVNIVLNILQLTISMTTTASDPSFIALYNEFNLPMQLFHHLVSISNGMSLFSVALREYSNSINDDDDSSSNDEEEGFNNRNPKVIKRRSGGICIRSNQNHKKKKKKKININFDALKDIVILIDAVFRGIKDIKDPLLVFNIIFKELHKVTFPVFKDNNDANAVMSTLLKELKEFRRINCSALHHDRKEDCLEEYLNLWREFLEITSWASIDDNEDSHNNNGIVLSTIHRSKGLEFSHVIVPRFNEGNIPLIFSDRECLSSNCKECSLCETVNEERRIAYVAMSRAKKSVLVSFLEIANNGSVACESRFITELKQVKGVSLTISHNDK